MIKAVLGGDALSAEKKASQRERIREFLQLKNTGFVKSGSTQLRDFLLTLKSDSGESRIKLLTIHASKGLEFERVFIVHVNEGFIPSDRAESDEEKAEELRLFYVAATRAEKQLYFSYVNSDDKIDDIQPSSFLDAIDSSLYEYTLADEYVFKEDDKPAPMVADVSSEISFSVGDIVETSRHAHQQSLQHLLLGVGSARKGNNDIRGEDSEWLAEFRKERDSVLSVRNQLQ